VKPAQTAFCVRRSLQCPQNESTNQMIRYSTRETQNLNIWVDPKSPRPEH
jgi:hypothetical protein